MGFARKLLSFFRACLGTQQIKWYSQEILCAQKFNSTIIDSEWFKYKSISPGGMAVDYHFFYTLYRILTSIRPQNILEFGLGQSSKMVHQYADFYKKEAITVENDKDWVNFFRKGLDGDYNINIMMLDLETILFKGEETVTYHNCLKTFQNKKFDLIIVDGPFHHDKLYSRTQIIDIAQNCLTDNFVIILDDYNDRRIQNTVEEVFAYFDEKGIGYVSKEYKGQKCHFVITTPKNKFLTTL